MPNFSIDVLKRRDFVLVLLTRICVVTALMAMDVIVGWQVYSITKSPFMLGLVGLTEAIPAIISAFWAGHIVDSYRPHRVFQIAVSVLMLTIVALCVIAGGHISAPDTFILPALFVGIFISGAARSFLMPSMATLIAQIVARSELSSASAWSSGSFQLAAVSGPATAGLLFGFYGASVVWLMPVTLILIGLCVVSCMSHKTRYYKNQRVREPMLQSILGGWRFIIKNPVLLSVMLLDMFAVLFGGAVAMLPAMADQVLHVGSEGLGVLRAASAIGAILTALFLAVRPFQTIRATTLLWAVAGFGGSIICFGLSESFVLSVMLLAIGGAFDSVSMVIRGTLMQWLTTDEVRGRVTAVNSMFIISSNEIGAFESGVAARVLGLVPSVVFGGAMCMLVVASTAVFSPKFRRAVVSAEKTH